LKLPAAPLKRDLRFAPTSSRESSKCKEGGAFIIVIRSLTFIPHSVQQELSAGRGMRSLRIFNSTNAFGREAILVNTQRIERRR